MNYDPDRLAQALQRAMAEKGFGQEQVAERVGVAQSTVSDWLNRKKNPSNRNLKKLLAALEIRYEDVEGGEQAAHLPSYRDPLGLLGESFTLTIYASVRAAAGSGCIVPDPDEELASRMQQSKRLFQKLLGFWPPDDLGGLYVRGESMEPGLEDGQLMLYQPVGRMISGQRYILLVEDPRSEDWSLIVKRVQLFAGGGLKLISDNRGLGLDDEVLLPGTEGGLVHAQTGLPVRLCVVGRVLWPRDGDDAHDAQIVTRTIERLSALGYHLTR